MNSAILPLNIGFLGLGFGGYIADTLVAGPGREFFSLAAVCDTDATKVAEYSVKHGVKACHSLDELLADKTIPVIGLFSGPAGRAELLRRIIRAGKDVMTTKPFELDPAAARSVLEEARALGRVIFLNSPPPEPPGYITQIQRWQREHELGQPVGCRGEMLVSYREKADGRWLDDPALCPAAPLFRIGIYPLNDLVRLFGPVSAVQVFGSRLFTGRPTPDNAQLNLRFANGALGSVLASFCVDNGQHYANSLTLHYERGTIYRNAWPVDYGQAEGSSRLQLVAAPRLGGLVRAEWTSPEIAGAYPWQTLHEAVTRRRAVPMPIEDVVSAIEIVAAMARAEKSGRTEMVRP
jgi:predicted dehydrogenase